ncbi:MAG: hypothetical protein E7373_06365 [Clostridiales bacterium]|nr:hypothetical protein [Clostridiales bacterium]
MTKETKVLLLEIATCPIKNSFVDCKTIKSVQDDNETFQCAEAWNGDIENAKILFISSNPSYDKKETEKLDNPYPNIQMTKGEELIDFFKNRFSNTDWKAYPKFWKRIAKFVTFIPEYKNKDKKVFFQEFVASTEIVHCKSTNEIGVNESCGKCFTLWTKKILSRFNGKYIVLVGKFACDRDFEIKRIIKDKIVIMTEHPNSRIKGNTDKVRQESFIKQIESQT